MRRIQIILFIIFAYALPVSSQIINAKPLSLRQTGYKIDAKLDTATKTVNGSMEAFWVNMSDDFVPDIQLHLYNNAFKNNRTTYNKEIGISIYRNDSETGWIDLKTLTDRDGNDLKNRMQYISPDDGNPFDQTVLQVILPKPARPGDTVFIKAEFDTRLPSIVRRTGYKDDFYFVAQWFPKFGVYESKGMRYATKGAWNCHQFHANSEFYSNHSLYDVTITVPDKYIVGSGGLLMSEKKSVSGNKYKSLIYRAEDIVDFAWTAWPGYKVFTDQWKNVKITLLLPEDRKEQVARHFNAARNALDYFSKNVGPYPWPYMTIVDPPAKGAAAAGMEYTTLFTTESKLMMPGFIRLPEMVTIHELGHAYFMGIMASNEFEEPWLDEGVNSFWEERILDNYYGENSGLIDHPFFKISDKAFGRISYVHSAGRQIISNKEYSWNYPHGTYGMMSYHKTATWLYTLMGIIGEETTNEVFREYYRKWAFRYPSGNDFVNVVNDVVRKTYGDKFGSNMNWFFDQTLYGTGLCDYKVSAIFNNKIEDTVDSASASDSTEKKKIENKQYYRSVAQLERDGEIMLPVEVLIHFNNGDEIHEEWDGKNRFKDFSYTGPRKVEWVKIDPDFKITMDINYINNSMTVAPDYTPLRRLTSKLMTFMQFFINFISI
jgi:hypothetical protein